MPPRRHLHPPDQRLGLIDQRPDIRPQAAAGAPAMDEPVGVPRLAAAAAGRAGYSNVDVGYPPPPCPPLVRLQRRAPGFVQGGFLTFNAAVRRQMGDRDDGAKRAQTRERVDQAGARARQPQRHCGLGTELDASRVDIMPALGGARDGGAQALDQTPELRVDGALKRAQLRSGQTLPLALFSLPLFSPLRQLLFSAYKNERTRRFVPEMGSVPAKSSEVIPARGESFVAGVVRTKVRSAPLIDVGMTYVETLKSHIPSCMALRIIVEEPLRSRVRCPMQRRRPQSRRLQERLQTK